MELDLTTFPAVDAIQCRRSRWCASGPAQHGIDLTLDAARRRSGTITRRRAAAQAGAAQPAQQRRQVHPRRRLASTVRAWREGDELVVTVTDTGIGIARADQERIFDSFQQGDAVGVVEPEGTGLGLTLSRRIVELHGGRMWLDERARAWAAPSASRIPQPGAGRRPRRRAGAEPAVDDARPDRRRHRGRPAAPAELVGAAPARRRAARRRRRAPVRRGSRRPGAATRGRRPRHPPARHGRLGGARAPSRPTRRLAGDPGRRRRRSMPERGRGFALGATDYLVKPVSEGGPARRRERGAVADAARTQASAAARRRRRRRRPARPRARARHPGAAGLGRCTTCAGGARGRRPRARGAPVGRRSSTCSCPRSTGSPSSTRCAPDPRHRRPSRSSCSPRSR